MVADVSDSGAASPAAFASTVASALSSSAFLASLVATLPTSVASVGSVMATAPTKRPTTTPTTAMVLDDDVAGVALTLINGNATYDNFGDALAAASYTLSLTSKPQSAVTLSVGGLGPFAVAVPTNVTIAPEDWATPVAFAVEASAPTAARPACASGARFCAAVAGRRTEAVTHAVASADPLYASLGLSPPGTDVALSVGVVHDAHAPPEVTGGRFSDLLNAIEVTFDTETDRANLAGSFACSRLLNLTAEAADMLFGDGSSCAFTSADTLKVCSLCPLHHHQHLFFFFFFFSSSTSSAFPSSFIVTVVCRDTCARACHVSHFSCPHRIHPQRSESLLLLLLLLLLPLKKKAIAGMSVAGSKEGIMVCLLST